MKVTKLFFLTLFTLFLFTVISCSKENNETQSDLQKLEMMSRSTTMYKMPDETKPHEGTWLQWPHQYEYGMTYRNRLEATWVAMTKQLVTSENVHIIAYNTAEKARIISLLKSANISLDNVDFKIMKTNDVWVRDNGPIFVKNELNKNIIEDWGFNGWGEKARFAKCNPIPTTIAKTTGNAIVNLNNKMIIEGGSFEIDGNGVLMATKSSILNANRNPGMTQAKAEAILSQYLGVEKFIWLDGVAGLEITDMHIDGFARFGDENTIVTMENSDLLYWELPQADINTLYNATDVDGNNYDFIYLPLTKNNVKTSYGKNLGYKGSYVNYYVANTKVLLPFYNDPNDIIARNILQDLYPDRVVVGIDVRNLYENGGMVHCVTQQQPL
jgi:agmatine deiminase